MKKDYNRMTTSDMPLESSLSSVVDVTKPKATKPKINAIGKTTATKSKNQITTKTSTKSTPQNSKTTKVEKSDVAQVNKTKGSKAKETTATTDLEKLNEENIKTFSYNSKRSKVVIAILATLLVVAIAVIAVYIAILKMDANCFLSVTGGKAVFIVNGEEMSKFRTPADLQGNRTLAVNIDLRIEESGDFDVKFKIDAYQNGVLLENTLAYWHGNQFFEGEDGYYYSKSTIAGGQLIDLCEGVCFDMIYENTLNADNFKLNFNVEIMKKV